MKNRINRDLFAYWNERRGQRAAPDRGDIEPNAIRHVLGDSFFLAADTANHYPFRLAGTRLCALFGHELKNESFLSLWGKADQATMRKLIGVVVEEKVGVVAHASARTTGEAPILVNLELLLLPLLQRSSLDARVLGALVPTTLPFWFGARVLGPLELGMLRHVGPTVEHRSASPLVAGAKGIATSSQPRAAGVRELRRKFMVYEGGRTD